MIHLRVALAQRIIFLTSDGDDDTIIIIQCMGLGLGVAVSDKMGNAVVRFSQTPDAKFARQRECQIGNEEKHHEFM